MLAIEMTLLTGNYVATAYNDRTRCEWPPHPARLFSALAATYFESGESGVEERAALEWLERQSPPTIAASNVGAEHREGREVVTVFVPTNDTTTVGSFEKEQEAMVSAQDEVDDARDALTEALDRGQNEGLKELERTLNKAQKKLQSAETRLEKRFEKAVSATGKISAADQVAARRLLPDSKGRQARTFPAISPDMPVVTFTWHEDPPSDILAALEGLLARVVRVGHSSSMVRLRVSSASPEPTLVPDQLSPTKLRVAVAGQLSRLEDQYTIHQETHPRVLPFAAWGYRPPVTTKELSLPASVFDEEWLVFELVAPSARRILSLLKAADVADCVRRALLEHAEEPIPETISGHSSDGGASKRPHIAVLPLPFVGTRYADGRLLGVALALPRDAKREERRAVFRAVGRWETAIRTQSDSMDETPLLPLGFGGPDGWRMRRLEEIARLRTLQSSNWCKPASTWVSATPIALDRNPGDLLSRNQSKQSAAFSAAESIISTACERIGLPRPENVIVSRAARIVGAEKCARYGRYPGDKNRNARVLVHATIHFATEVKGPIILGAGRFAGLGLCKPIDENPPRA